MVNLGERMFCNTFKEWVFPRELSQDRVWREDPDSKAAFETEFQALVEKRLREERVYQQIASTHPSHFFSMAAYTQPSISGRDKSLERSESEVDRIVEQVWSLSSFKVHY